ncbi:MAG: FecR domain-containing protein [Flavobacteriaceae bacterium]|uniref:FecR family protein n=1 Tax=Flagellimonas sp. SN16 TaxID=3415142 RepID=UPI003C53AC34|nr:FecR domain-containing protein [Flavobacteriaceae bacterium]
MTENKIKRLMQKYLDGTITEKEESVLEEFDKNLLHRNMDGVFKDPSDKRRIEQRLSKAINKPKNRGTNFGWIRVAASVAILLGFGYLAFTKFDQEPVQEAVLEVVRTTDWGQKLELTLSDGTLVRLNSGSSLKFPDRFEGNTREVELEGEAFFDVARNPDKPFVIKSDEVRTTVLGTSFNVNTYSHNQHIAVTVATGKVEVASRDDKIFLGPNEQGVFNRNTKAISKEQTDISAYLNWKEGILSFEDAALTEVTASLERWYGVTLMFENDSLGDCHLTATYTNETLGEVLESIVYTKKGLRYDFLGDKKIRINGTCTD